MTMDALTAAHGYASTGESFSIADPNEVRPLKKSPFSLATHLTVS